MYNDGKILAYIQEKQYYFQWGSKNARYVKSDELIIENISVLRPKSSTETQNVVTVPAWAQGTWGRYKNNFNTIPCTRT
jgi:hypothetical protein